VYALDLRNHGHSPAAAPHTYAAMAADVLAFLAAHRLSRVQLLGHSMGGKAAMAVALAAPDALASRTSRRPPARCRPSSLRMSIRWRARRRWTALAHGRADRPARDRVGKSVSRARRSSR
jgi:pimeloyl-ACP methyl ester carboxylesterase